MKTILLMRHSIANKTIGNNETHPLSEEGILKVKAFSNNPIFNHINKIVSSPYLRAYQTANTFSDSIIQDERLIERLIGEKQTAHKSQWKKQYDDHNYKNTNGESLNEVKVRMSSCINEILNEMNENEKVLIVSHATSICSYLLNVCDIEVIDENNKIRKITFNNKVILEDRIQTPCCFKIQYKNNKIINIEYIS